MGTNRHYRHTSGQRAEEIALREARKHGPPATVTAAQVRLHERPVTVVPEQVPMWGLAWLRFGDVDVRCTVLVRRWTDDAVGVVVAIDKERHRVWIWQGACQRLANRADAW